MPVIEEPFFLEQAGRALFGRNWQTELADALYVSDRSVRRWKKQGSIPQMVRGGLRMLLRRRLIRIQELLDERH